MKSIPAIPKIRDEERTPLVSRLLEIIGCLFAYVQKLKDEIARLKGHKPRPKIKPSTLEKNSRSNKDKQKEGNSEKRPGSAKRAKTRTLQIHNTEVLKPQNVPPGSKFKGCNRFTVQGIRFELYNTLYLMQRWLTPEGKSIVASLPDEVKELGHFNAPLHCFILHQYHHCHVTQPLILSQLLEIGVDISAGEVNRIITEDKERFHAEKDDILRIGLEMSSYINVDDTGARHKGKNGYCTHIGNEMFAWFESTSSKSRINFLEIMRAGNKDYVVNSTALDYMNAHKLPKVQTELLVNFDKRIFEDRAQWKAALKSLGFTKEGHIRIATEGALLGSILEHGVIKPDLVVLSDDAGQFNVLLHALCWIHAERSINKLVGCDDSQREALAHVRTHLWELYADLKAYKQAPSLEKKCELEQRFDQLFTTKTCYDSLNQALTRIHKNKEELLLVLVRPEIPLHNNGSETDLRDYVKKRTISGSTRSDQGRRCRDTFASLKKTCLKQGVGFWQYLVDRISWRNVIPPLSQLLLERLRE